jgi:photosystem II stability/assembly factor-like uncharacterized protein
MKKFYIFLATLVAVNGTIAQWVPQNSGTTNNLNSVYFTDANTGYAVGDSGTIIKTADGGASWTEQISPTDSVLVSVCFPDANIGYVVGLGGNIIKTINGGTTWISLLSGTTNTLTSVFFTDPNTGYVVGYDGIILKTVDGGVNWTNLISGVLTRLYDVFFTSADTGYVSGHSQTILKTCNGGITWSIIYQQPQQYMDGLFSLFFPDVNTGYAVGTEIYKTINSGSSWTCLASSPTLGWNLGSVHFTDVDTGFAVGSSYPGAGIIWETNDGGATWIQQGVYPQNYNSVYFTDADTGYIVGVYGCILKTLTGGGIVGINNISATSNSLKIYPNPSCEMITVENAEIPYIGKLYILNIDGQTLIKQSITEQSTQIYIGNLPSGIYFVRLTNKKTVQMGKFLKE